QTARVMFAAVPVRPKLPDGFVAVEFSSVEQAQKFEAQLRAFLTAHVKPKNDEQASKTTAPRTTTTNTNPYGTTTTTTSVAPLPEPSAAAQPTTGRAAVLRGNAAQANKPEASAPPFFVERAGALIVSSDTQFSLAALHPAGAPLLTDEPGFQAARAHFAHEMLFVYFNMKRIERNAEQQRKKHEREAARQRAEMQRKQGGTQMQPDNNDEAVLGTGANPTLTAQATTPEPTNNDENASNTRTEIVAVPMTTTIPAPTVPTTIVAEPTPDEPPAPVEEKKLTPEEQAQVERQRANEQFLSLLPSVIFGGLNGGNSWPESIALAGELDGDSLV